MKMSLATVAKIVAGELIPTSAAAIEISAVDIDTRRLPPQSLFVALAGEHSDGHDHLAAAQQAGAVAAVVRQAQTSAEVQTGMLAQIVVADSAAALQQLALFCRQHYHGKVAAITGSNGKTTVKEMLYSIATAAMGEDKVLRSHGNFNNHLGVPLMLLQLNPLQQIALLEAGMDHRGELTALSALIQPQVALINNAQRAHIGNFSSLHEIACAKGELLSGLAANGCAVLNADDAHFSLWCELAADKKIISFGQAQQADIHGTFTEEGIIINGVSIRLAVAGAHNKMNALAAAAAAHALGLPTAAVVQGLSRYQGAAGRLTVHRVSPQLTLIDDTYNANLDSTLAGLAVLATTAAANNTQAVLVMGDMLALGEQTQEAHDAIVAACRQQQILLLGWGAQMQQALARDTNNANSDNRHFTDRALLIEEMLRLAQTKKITALVKGSRGMQMEKIVNAIVATSATVSRVEQGVN
ncbi:MAG: UDP-N-acetylmuramoyl-tripeptide--D-alanyl-D-alanine ligase [Proteobacteria bacterium]|nr:UDP-N-acetylmuramoyl-tripeptide--D-alanyl-D-alanine ligase [Pseudomonadota bacterium]